MEQVSRISRRPAARRGLVLVLAGLLGLMTLAATSKDPNAVPYQPGRAETLYGTWSAWRLVSGGQCTPQPRIDMGTYYEDTSLCAPGVERRTRTNTNVFYEERWLYDFHHINHYSSGGRKWTSECTVWYYSNDYEAFGRPGTYGVNVWGPWIPKSPDGSGALVGSHGCGHAGSLQYHEESVRIEKLEREARREQWTQTEERAVAGKTIVTRRIAKAVPT